jgi:hypothetical protein
MTDFVVFYSLTGKARETAERLAKAMGANLVEIEEERPKKPGIVGFTSAMLDSLFKRKPKTKATPEVGAGDRVVLCGPIWAGRIAGPIRTWLAERGAHVGQLIWAPHSGMKGEWPKATAEVTALAGQDPIHIVPFIEEDFARGKAEGQARELSELLKAEGGG